MQRRWSRRARPAWAEREQGRQGAKQHHLPCCSGRASHTIRRMRPKVSVLLRIREQLCCCTGTQTTVHTQRPSRPACRRARCDERGVQHANPAHAFCIQGQTPNLGTHKHARLDYYTYSVLACAQLATTVYGSFGMFQYLRLQILSEMFEPYLDEKRRARRFQRGIVRLQQSSFSLHFDSRLFAALHTVVWGDYPHQAILRERRAFL